MPLDQLNRGFEMVPINGIGENESWAYVVPEVEIDRLLRIEEAAQQVVRGCEAWPSWTTGHIGFTLRKALATEPSDA